MTVPAAAGGMAPAGADKDGARRTRNAAGIRRHQAAIPMISIASRHS